MFRLDDEDEDDDASASSVRKDEGEAVSDKRCNARSRQEMRCNKQGLLLLLLLLPPPSSSSLRLLLLMVQCKKFLGTSQFVLAASLVSGLSVHSSLFTVRQCCCEIFD